MTKLKESIKTFVRDATGDEDELIMKHQTNKDECKIMVFAMSTLNLNASIPVIFRSYPALNNAGLNCTIWEALCATMAHPDLFRSFTIDGPSLGDKQSFVDAGMGCNNPLARVLAEVKDAFPGRHVASIASIGTGHARTIQVPDPGPLRWVLPTNAIVAMKEIATDSERVAQDMAARFGKSENFYFRLSVNRGMEDVGLSKWERLSEVMVHTRRYMQEVEVKQNMDKLARAVKEKRPIIPTDQIDGEIQGPPKNVCVKRCPAPTPVFTGRQDEIGQVENSIVGTESGRKVCVIHGIGGSGKTQLALKAIDNTFDKWSEVFYVDASSLESTESGLRAFAVAKNIGKTHQDMVEWLGSHDEPWLVVFDGADDPSFNIQEFLPRGNLGSVLITTRISAVRTLARDGCDWEISSMKPDEGLALLLTTARIQSSDLAEEELKEAKELLKDFNHLAFSIVHAGAYLRDMRDISISQYRRDFRERQLDALESYSGLTPAEKIDDYVKTVYTVWVMCYELLGPRARALFWLLAFLHHEGITRDIFRRAATNNLSRNSVFPPTELEIAACNKVQEFLSHYLDSNQSWNNFLFSDTMKEITSRSLIEYDGVNQAYRMHTLVQDWVHTVIPEGLDLSLECTRALVSLSTDRSHAFDSVQYKLKLLLHVKKLAARADTLSPNHALAFSYVYDQGNYWKGLEKLHRQLLEIQTRIYSSNHPSTLKSMNNLAYTLIQQGRWGEAETYGRLALDIQERLLGLEDPDTLASIANLAAVFIHREQSDEAEKLGRQAFDLGKRILDPEHPDMLRIMNNLAAAYQNRGRWHEAEELQVEMLGIRKRVLGEEHPDTLMAMNTLALTYMQQGRWCEAEELGKQALGIQKRLLGDEHPATLTTTVNLASVYSNQGRWNKAEELEVQVLDARKRTLGEEHPDTLISMNNLAATYQCLGKWNEGKGLQSQALDIQTSTLGEQHPDTLKSMSNLAIACWKQGLWNESETMGLQVLERQKRVLGEEHPDTLTSMNNLASTYTSQGRWDDAEELGSQVFQIQSRVLREEHPDTLTSMSNLALIYWNKKQLDEAERLGERALETRKRLLGEEHPDTLTDMSNLAATYWDQGRKGEAETLEEQVLEIRKRVLGDEHPDTLTSKNNLAITYCNQGRWDKGAELQAQVVKVYNRILGAEHPYAQKFQATLERMQLRSKSANPA